MNMQVSTKLTKVNDNTQYISVESNAAKFRVYFLDKNIIRIRTTFDKKFSSECSYALTKTAWDDITDEFMSDERTKVVPEKYILEKFEKFYLATSEKYILKINKFPFYFEISDKHGHVLHKDLPQRSFLKDRLGRQFHYSVMGKHDLFYGFGEKAGLLNKYKYRMRMHNTDTLGWNAERSDPLYKMIPFYIDFDEEKNIASGIYYNNSSDSVFDMNCEHSSYWKSRFSYFQCDSGELDFFFIGGPTIKDVVHHYTDLTGKTAMPPISTIGYMGSTMYYTELDAGSDQAIIKFVDTCKKQKIPCDGFFLSSGYTSIGKKRYVFNWNKKRFPNPQKFVEVLKKKGVLLSPNVKPGMLLSHPLVKDFENKNAYIKNAESSEFEADRYWGGNAYFVDFTNESGRKVWAKAMENSLLSLGITSIWNDNNEYEINDDDASINLEGKGGMIGDVRPIMPTLMAKVARTALQKHSKNVRPYITNRAGFAGIQRYAQTWAGDNRTSWRNFKYNIPTILGMGLSGVANQGCDIGGFDGPAPEPELFVRWVQNGIFQPRFTIHSCNDDNTVTEPWMYPSYTKYIRDAIQLRYKLVPYFYSLFWEAATLGSPIMRPLVYEFQEDSNVNEESFEFMLGESILVANVLEKGKSKKSIYLPSGAVWTDLKTLKQYKGGQNIIIPIDLGTIPMFLRSGSFVPMAPGLMNIHNEEIDHLSILVEPTKDSTFNLYEDDGVSNDFKKGVFLETIYTLNNVNTQNEKFANIHVERNGTYLTKIKKIDYSILSRETAPMMVELNEHKITEYLDDDDFCMADEGWFYDDEKQIVKIKTNNPKEKSYDLKVTFKRRDLLIV